MKTIIFASNLWPAHYKVNRGQLLFNSLSCNDQKSLQIRVWDPAGRRANKPHKSVSGHGNCALNAVTAAEPKSQVWVMGSGKE